MQEDITRAGPIFWGAG